jgi:hypothetical protein
MKTDSSSLVRALQDNGTSSFLSGREPTALRRLNSRKGWALLAFILLLQWMLFLEFIRREILWSYPTAFDQGVYLSSAYDSYERFLAKGPLEGLWHVITIHRPTGVMLDTQAAVLFLFLGPSRHSALTLNFLYFAAFQLVLAYTLFWLTGRFAFAFIAIGLLLSVSSPFYVTGGLADFRMDLIASCLYGIFLCMVVRSNVFQSRAWSLVAAFTAMLLVLFRFLSFVYFAGIFLVLLVFLLLRQRRQRAVSEAYEQTSSQIRNLLFSAAVLLMAVAPAFWHNRDAIRQYYVVGTTSAPEAAIYAKLFSSPGVWEALVFYPRSVLRDHAGLMFLILSGLILTFAVVAGRSRSTNGRAPGMPIGFDLSGAYCVAVAALACPTLILTILVSRSPVIGGNLVSPLLMIVVLTVVSRMASQEIDRPGASQLLSTIAGLILLVGLLLRIDLCGRRPHYIPSRADTEQIFALYDTMADYCRKAAWVRPVVSVDLIADYLSFPTIEAAIYERHRLSLDVQGALGASMLAVSVPEAIVYIRGSDFVVMTTSGHIGPSPFPFDQTVASLRPALIDEANKQLVALRQFRIFGRGVTLYARHVLRLEGDSGGWITSEGVTLYASGAAVRTRPRVELLGQFYPQYLKRLPGVTGRLIIPGSTETRSVSASLFSSSADAYQINLDLDSTDLPIDTLVEIRLTFDTYFVPKALGINEDMRELVIRTPTTVRFAN